MGPPFFIKGMETLVATHLPQSATGMKNLTKWNCTVDGVHNIWGNALGHSHAEPKHCRLRHYCLREPVLAVDYLLQWEKK